MRTLGSLRRSKSTQQHLRPRDVATRVGPYSRQDPAAHWAAFRDAAAHHNLVPVYVRLTSDQLTPVTAYRCLVPEGDFEVPSFLFESVQNGTDTGRFSFVGARPCLEILAQGTKVTVLDHMQGTRQRLNEEDPVSVPVSMSRSWRAAPVDDLPDVFTGGWVGYTGYDTVRYTYPRKIPFSGAPHDDRNLLDMHLGLYKDAVVFDNATKLVYAVAWAEVPESSTARSNSSSGSEDALEQAWRDAVTRASALQARLSPHAMPTLASAAVSMSLSKVPTPPARCNTTREAFLEAVEATKEHVRAGDVFQLVLSQRFERGTYADPLEVYRALRIVNPSPYMCYMQSRRCILVAASPEILCRVDSSRVITNRPLAGTRPRGATPDQDAELEQDLLADEKEKAEHIMLVDLGRNDVGKVSEAGSVSVDKLMAVERYSHVMHISSSVSGKLLPELDAWDALRAALPVGTISGAPKVRALQIIDELEPNRRGPYGGGYGYVSFSGSMDMALALRTMVIPTDSTDALYSHGSEGAGAARARREWQVHLQAGAGLVADSVPESEYQETINKANALSRAIDLAEDAFLPAEHRCNDADARSNGSGPPAHQVPERAAASEGAGAL